MPDIYLFFPWRSSVLGHIAGKSLEKRNQVRAILSGKVQRLDLLVEIWVGVAASGVKIDDILKRLEAAVVHIGASQGNIAQGWRLELAFVGF